MQKLNIGLATPLHRDNSLGMTSGKAFLLYFQCPRIVFFAHSKILVDLPTDRFPCICPFIHTAVHLQIVHVIMLTNEFN